MKKAPRIFLAVALLGGALSVTAQTLKPGLWAFTSNMGGGSGAMGAAMAEAQKKLASMPPEQRKMMEDMMAKRGLGMGIGADGAVAVKICMTKEMVERDEFGTQQGDCKHTMSPRVGNTMQFSFTCTQPPSNGEGTFTLVSSENYTSKMRVTTMVRGKQETVNMDSTGKFLTSDCGAVKPLPRPAN